MSAGESRHLTTACTRPRIARLSSRTCRMQLYARRVMPGVMSPLHVESMKIPAAPQLNAVEVVGIMRAAG
jgi:hypothetical protein